MKFERGAIVDVGKAIDDGPWGPFQKLCLALASLAFVVDALANQVMAISIPAIMRDWHLTRSAFAPVIAMGWVGVAIGAIVAGSLADIFGRKTLLLASILLFGAATTAVAFTTNLNTLLILRTIDGVGIGGAIPAATTLIAEFTPARRRSRAINIGMICIPLGNFLCGAIGSAILPQFGWRTLFAVNGCISVAVCGLLLVAMPESPRFLARAASRRMRLMRDLAKFGIEVSAGAQWVEGGPAQPKARLAALLGPRSLATTLALWGGFYFCFLAVYSSLNWMPTLLASRGYGLSVTSLALSAAGIGGMLGSIMMARLIELFGSRMALLISVVEVAIGVAVLTQLPLVPGSNIVSLMLALALVSLALNGITGCIYALAAHVYPTAVKGTGMGAAGSVGRIGAITSSYLAVAVLASGSSAFFVLIGVSALISVALLMMIGRHIPNDKGFARGTAAAEAAQQ